MAKILEDMGHQWEYEHLLEIIIDIPNTTAHFLKENPCFSLAESLVKTSKAIGRDQGKLWRETSVDDDVPEDSLLPALHRAVLLGNAEVMEDTLLQQNGVNFIASPFEERFVQETAGIDTRDFCQRTALFFTAVCGFEQGCTALVQRSANPNIPDDYGHTILEVASSGGHLNIVKILIDASAQINPPFI